MGVRGRLNERVCEGDRVYAAAHARAARPSCIIIAHGHEHMIDGALQEEEQQQSASANNGQPVSAGRGPVTFLCGSPREGAWCLVSLTSLTIAPGGIAQHKTTCEVVDRYPKSGTRSKRQARE